MSARTNIIVEVPLAVIKAFMDEDFFHPELLLHSEVAFIQGIFPQDDGEALRIALISETQIHKISLVTAISLQLL